MVLGQEDKDNIIYAITDKQFDSIHEQLKKEGSFQTNEYVLFANIDIARKGKIELSPTKFDKKQLIAVKAQDRHTKEFKKIKNILVEIAYIYTDFNRSTAYGNNNNSKNTVTYFGFIIDAALSASIPENFNTISIVSYTDQNAIDQAKDIDKPAQYKTISGIVSLTRKQFGNIISIFGCGHMSEWGAIIEDTNGKNPGNVIYRMTSSHAANKGEK